LLIIGFLPAAVLGLMFHATIKAGWLKPGAFASAVDFDSYWQGEALAGKSLLLIAEQGIGDTLQFIRYASLLADQGARVGLHVRQVHVAGLLRNPGVNIGSPYLLGPIAAVVIGGAALSGGLASSLSTFAAAFFLTGLNQMMRALGLATSLQFLVFGLVIIGGMLISGDRIIKGVERVLRDRRKPDMPWNAEAQLPIGELG